ncbi:hypothetical protein [Algoriphagus litoralis]|uniref:hypothetical protein n=1 Tax=Algoriphagus litoralis TaxID=2202829 RepID=UPI000DBA1E3C|nr:hypothetical protein [Algoriphagus litoralis]
MNIQPIILSPSVDILEPKLTKKFTSLSNLIFAAGKHHLPDPFVTYLNKEIQSISQFPGNTEETSKMLGELQKTILKKLEKEYGLVPRNHYRNLWIPLGVGGLGLPIGLIFGFGIGNMAFLGAGLPIGLGLGVAIGTYLDQKAEKEGRQLEFEVS